MWWADLFWGIWNGFTAWVVLVVHIFGGWEQFPFYNEARSGNWYDIGFLLGAGSPPSGSDGREGPEGLRDRVPAFPVPAQHGRRFPMTLRTSQFGKSPVHPLRPRSEPGWR